MSEIVHVYFHVHAHACSDCYSRLYRSSMSTPTSTALTHFYSDSDLFFHFYSYCYLLFHFYLFFHVHLFLHVLHFGLDSIAI